MLISSRSGALVFKRINITKFVKKYKELYEDFGLGEKEKIKRFL